MACKAGTHQPSLPPVQSQVNREGEGDSRIFNFVRENPHEQGVDCIRRIDSKGHLCGESPLHAHFCLLCPAGAKMPGISTCIKGHCRLYRATNESMELTRSLFLDIAYRLLQASPSSQ